MFAVRLSYVSLLQTLMFTLRDVHVDYVLEVADDGTVIAAVEVVVPLFFQSSPSRRFFFWSSPSICYMLPYEQAAFQAVVFLQLLYGFVFVDYSFYALFSYRTLADSAVALALNLLRSMPYVHSSSYHIV